MKGYLVVRHFNQLLPFPGSVNNLLLGVFCNQEDAILFLRRFYDLESVSLVESNDLEIKASGIKEIPLSR